MTRVLNRRFPGWAKVILPRPQITSVGPGFRIPLLGSYWNGGCVDDCAVPVLIVVVPRDGSKSMFAVFSVANSTGLPTGVTKIFSITLSKCRLR